jgi:hypothetical protein
MNRLAIINFINHSWYKQVTEFLNEHPAFNKLVPIVALDEYPTGFNRNPYESDSNAPINIFETIVWGLALAGCDVDYGKDQYNQMVKYLRTVTTFTKDMDFPFDVQPEKYGTYQRLINRLLDLDIPPTEFKYEQMHLVEDVEGMTESTVTLLHLLYDVITTEKCLPYGDKQFKRGMCMFYELESPTKEELKKITATWRNKKVGLMFVVQYAHYSEYVDE